MLKIILLFAINCSIIYAENYNNQFIQDSSILNCANDNTGIDVAFIRLGKYRGEDDNGFEYQKSYFLSRYFKAEWPQAKAYCKAFNLQLASFETITEASTFLETCEKSSYIPSAQKAFYLIDGLTLTPKSPSDWYWTNSGKKVSYDLPWTNNQPDYTYNREYCLTIGKVGGNDKLGFNDYTCIGGIIPFICQKVDFYLH